MKPYEITPHVYPANASVDLDHLPGESLLSSLCRFAWRNSMDPETLFAYCSGRDVQKPGAGARYGGFTERFAAISGWSIDSAEVALVRESSERNRWLWWSTTMRYCPVCLEHLYHSYWHQCEFLTTCPFDGAPLVDRCYECGAYVLLNDRHNAILNTPYICRACKRPISGVKPNVDLRLAFQERRSELGRTVSKLQQWWKVLTPARQAIEVFLPTASGTMSTNRLRPASSVRQWVLDDLQ